jgi:carbon storage regulator CsrA
VNGQQIFTVARFVEPGHQSPNAAVVSLPFEQKGVTLTNYWRIHGRGKKTKTALCSSFCPVTIQCWGQTQHWNVPNRSEIAMLVLRRRIGEEIIINDNIRIVVSQTTDHGCSLAIEAPKSCRIRRAELPPFQETIVQKVASALQVQQ